jgi:hypothetical protein
LQYVGPQPAALVALTWRWYLEKELQKREGYVTNEDATCKTNKCDKARHKSRLWDLQMAGAKSGVAASPAAVLTLIDCKQSLSHSSSHDPSKPPWL